MLLKKCISIIAISLIFILNPICSLIYANGFDTNSITNNLGPNVSLTFDVEGGNDIEYVLDILKEYQVKCTFFLLASWVEKYPDSARRVINEGHEIGNHSYSHPNLTKLSKDQIIREIQRAENIITSISGVSPRPLFRPPFGAQNTKVIQAIGEAGYKYSCLWSIDPRDWDGKPAEAITDIILEKLHPGAVVLLHLNKTNTPMALESMLKGIIEKGYTVELLSHQIGRIPNIMINTATYTSQNRTNTYRFQTKDNISANLALNGELIYLSQDPVIISNRIFVPIREIAGILGSGQVEWNSKEMRASLSIWNNDFQFNINGDILVNNEVIEDVPRALLINGTTMVPLYVISSRLGLTLSWDEDSMTANLTMQ
jgi:peptidoglycan/xylan/chitin deacetylase (PgdA/CDA1 family)